MHGAMENVDYFVVVPDTADEDWEKQLQQRFAQQ